MTMPCKPIACPPTLDVGRDVPACSDTLSRDGARALAKRLQGFWRDQGYPSVCFWAEPVDERFAKVGSYEIYRVACNLVNGLPPPYRANPPAARAIGVDASPPRQRPL